MTTDYSPSVRAQLVTGATAARDELVRRGRCTGEFMYSDGTVCALGAIGVATVDGFEDMTFRKCGDAIDMQERPRQVLSALNDQLRIHHPGEVNVWSFNDHKGTTDADVLALYDKALAELGGLA